MPFDFDRDENYTGGWKSGGGFQNPPRESDPVPPPVPRAGYTPPAGRSVRPSGPVPSVSFSFIAKVAMLAFAFIIGYGIFKNMSVITYFIGMALGVLIFVMVLYFVLRAFFFGGRRRR